MEKKYIFIAGLHRSGTTILGDIVKGHPSITGLTNTGVSMDEGQLIQSVYPAAKKYGGPGKFGFSPEMHVVETSDLITNSNRELLLSEWGKYWDTSSRIFVEKSPPNLLKTRFLQKFFPNSLFVVIYRHPIAVSLATKRKWKNSSIEDLIHHWIHCHKLYKEDEPYLKNVVSFTYEDFVLNPKSYLELIFNTVEVEMEEINLPVKSNINQKYFDVWKKWKNRLWNRKEYNRIISRFEEETNNYGYSLVNLK